MPPDRGRASKACTACRKQKTRCYGSRTGSSACLRCERLEQQCSLHDDALGGPGQPRSHPFDGGALRDERLDRLERTVNLLVERLGGELGAVLTPRDGSADRMSSSPDRSNQHPTPAVAARVAGTSTAPLLVIRDVATEVGIDRRDETNMPPLGIRLSSNIIEDGLVSLQEASSLLQLFHENYGRWVYFNTHSESNDLLAEVQKSPLLLCACCLIAVRHTSLEAASTLALRLFKEASSLLSEALLVVPQSIYFFQAALILSQWSTTISRVPLSVDSWLLSGFALQHCHSTNLFDPVLSKSKPASMSRSELDRWCIWNHLCLVHLHYCVGTRRKAMVDREYVERCRMILDSDHATNFESRIVAEINLYWIIYEGCSAVPIDLPKTQAALNTWKQEWNFIFDLPRSQFVQMGFHFAQLLLYDQSLKSRSAAVRESLLSEMVRLSAAILRIAMDTADNRTRHLSDHIYHMITFAAVTLCRLLHMYEKQLATNHDIVELDALVLTLVTWLHSIGLPCHVAHTLGDVVSAFHKKLRPDSQPSPFSDVDLIMQSEILQLFPEFMGADVSDWNNGILLPDWAPFMQGPSS